ncbi:MAG: hypothetical protein HZB09_00500 [Candidatus Yonathbacteria bacterium]|nr:hypothetical protein [Candidatus Yonathbacteria bacterium]
MINTDELNGTLLKDLGLEGFPKDIQDEVITRLGDNVLQRVTLAIVNKISPSARQEFDSIAEAADSNRMKTFLDAQIPDFDNFVKNEVHKSVLEFKQIAAAV